MKKMKKVYNITKRLVFVVFILVIISVAVFLMNVLHYWLLDKYLESDSDYKVCDVNGCRYITITRNSTCYQDGKKIDCNEIPPMERYYQQIGGGIE
jgi:hypothetical protein